MAHLRQTSIPFTPAFDAGNFPSPAQSFPSSPSPRPESEISRFENNYTFPHRPRSPTRIVSASTIASPERPPRPRRPDEAVFFNLNQNRNNSPGSNNASRDSWDSAQEVDLATFIMMPAPVSVPSTRVLSGSIVRPTLLRPHSAVPPLPPISPIAESSPEFRPLSSDTPQASGPSSSRLPSPLGQPISTKQSRLSISGFEALLARGEEDTKLAHATSVKGKGRALTVHDNSSEETTPGDIYNYYHDSDLGLSAATLSSFGNDPDDFRAIDSSSTTHLHPSTRNQSARSNHQVVDISSDRGLQVQPAPGQARDGVPWRRPSVAARERALQQTIPVVVMDADFASKEDYLDVPMGETFFRQERMNFSMVKYTGLLARLFFLIYPILIFFHFPATLFLDYNVIYTLVQLGLDPSFPSSTPLPRRAHGIVNIPDLHPAIAFWVALGVYAACTVIWGVVVCLWRDFLRGYVWKWERGTNIAVEKVYMGAASFSFASMKSFGYFSFFFRLRLAPFQRKGPLAIPGTTWADGVYETASWYSQNWPTVMLLIPRGGLSLAILLLYGTNAYGSSSIEVNHRDEGYFSSSDGILSPYAVGFLLANCVWAAWRVLLVLFSTLVLCFFHGRERAYEIRRNRRFRAAILLCSKASPNPTPVIPSSGKFRYAKPPPRKLSLGGIDWKAVDRENSLARERRERQHRPRREVPRWDSGLPYVPPVSVLEVTPDAPMPSEDDATRRPSLPAGVGWESNPRAGSVPPLHQSSPGDSPVSPHHESRPFSMESKLSILSEDSKASLHGPPAVVTPPLFSSAPSLGPTPFVSITQPTPPPVRRQDDGPVDERDQRLDDISSLGSLSPPSRSKRKRDAPWRPIPYRKTSPTPPDHDPYPWLTTEANDQSTRASLLERQLSQVEEEKLRLSNKLLVQVQRQEEADEQAGNEERRLAGLSLISENSCEGDERPISSANSIDSGEWPTDDLAAANRGFLLPPFRLSYGSTDQRLSTDSGRPAFEFDDVSASEHHDDADRRNSTLEGFSGSGDSTSDTTFRSFSSPGSEESTRSTPTQAKFSSATHPNRHVAIHQSHSGDTFGITSRTSRS